MPTIDVDGATRAKLYVRDTLPKPARTARRRMESRLERAVENGVLSGYDVVSWAKRVPLAADAEGAFERERHEQFTNWAEREGVSLEPFFDTRECYCMETAERRRELVLPAALLVLYQGEDVALVAPHRTASGSVSVGDCLDALAERGATPDRRTVTAD